MSDLFGRKRTGLARGSTVALEERLGVEQRLRELDRLGDELRTIDRLLGEAGTGASVTSTQTAAAAGGDDFSALRSGAAAQVPERADTRSRLGRAVDALLTPVVSPEAARRITGSQTELLSPGILGNVVAVQAMTDIGRNPIRGHVGATIAGFCRGAVERPATLTDLVSLASLLTGGAGRAVRPALVRSLRGLPTAARALISARSTASSVEDIARLRNELACHERIRALDAGSVVLLKALSHAPTANAKS